MKNKKFKFSSIELLIIIISAIFIGLLSATLIDKIIKNDPYLNTLGLVGMFLFPLATIIVRTRIKVIEIKTEI